MKIKNPFDLIIDLDYIKHTDKRLRGFWGYFEIRGIRRVKIYLSRFLEHPERTDKRRGIVAHEFGHVRLFGDDLLYWFKYTFSKKHRQEYELYCYALQTIQDPDSFERNAQDLARNYKLDLDVEEARLLLRDKVRELNVEKG